MTNFKLGLKVCGMKYRENIEAVSALQPDYLGFIFFEKSKRNFEGNPIEISANIKKVGVFVNETIPNIEEKSHLHSLDVIQLHGDESSGFCGELKEKLPEIKIWKAFSVDKDFEFEKLKNYSCADAFLFDTKGENPGGNGIKFDWEILENYHLDIPIILSGGISIDDVETIRNLKNQIPQIEIIDINSKFEIEPGLKNIERIKNFYEKLKLIR